MPDWKGMLKKGKDLARQARSELEERGILGDERSRGTGAGRDWDQEELPPDEQVYRMTGPDHPHPFTLLTADDVAAALGVGPNQVQGPTANVVDECAGPTYYVRSSDGEVAVNLLLYVHPIDVEELLGYTEDFVEPLAGVGEKAAISREMVAVSQGDEVVSVHFSGGPPVDRRRELVTLAQAVVARLGG